MQAAHKATQEILPLLRQHTQNLYALHSRGAGGDVSIGADLLSEQIYMKYLLPLASVDSEESGFVQGEGSDYIVLDPLDGSDNFLSHIPYYGSSLALCDKHGKVKEAIIFNFCTQEAIARVGDVTFSLMCGDKSIDSKTPLSTAQSPQAKCGIFEKAYTNPHIAAFLYENGLKFRSLGASALSMAKAFEVNFMLFAGNMRTYDSKAGLFICEPLWHISTKNFTLISKDKHIFDIIRAFLFTTA